MNLIFKALLLGGMITLCSLMNINAQSIRFKDKTLPCLEKNFNLQVFMTVDSVNRLPLLVEEEVQIVLEEASTHFEPICMSFSTCDMVIIENYGYNMLDDDLRAKEAGVVFGLPRRINLFFVKKIFGNDCGFSNRNGFFTEKEAHIFIELGCTDSPSVQLAHHMGHLLGLLPTNFGQANELVDGSNCEIAGDQICDTPADPFGMIRDDNEAWKLYETGIDERPIYLRDCEFVWETKDNNGDFYMPHTSNFMSPYPCKCEFTFEQYLKMVDNFNASPIKQY